MKVVACIIARTNSRRLPSKVLRKLWVEKTIIEFLIERLKRVERIDTIYICTSSNEEDNILEEIALENSIKCYRGSPENVLERMLSVGEIEDADCLIRITGDNPLTSIEYLEEQLKILEFNNLDYVRINGIPIGATAEIIRREALIKCSSLMDPSVSEYLMLYIFDPNNFRCGVMKISDSDYSSMSITIDSLSDLERMKEMINAIKRKDKLDISLMEIIDYHLKSNTGVSDSNPNTLTIINMPFGKKISLQEHVEDMANRELKSEIFYING